MNNKKRLFCNREMETAYRLVQIPCTVNTSAMYSQYKSLVLTVQHTCIGSTEPLY